MSLESTTTLAARRAASPESDASLKAEYPVPVMNVQREVAQLQVESREHRSRIAVTSRSWSGLHYLRGTEVDMKVAG